MLERDLKVDHKTIHRCVQRYSPEIEKRCKLHLRSTNDMYRLDENYIKVRGEWKYLYRAVDSDGSTIEFLLCAKRDREAVKRFFRIAFEGVAHLVAAGDQRRFECGISICLQGSETERLFSKSCQLRQNKYLNNIVEQVHRFIKRRVKPGLGFHSFRTARKTLSCCETMHMIRKGQIQGIKNRY
jgi:IS6 family transposase